MDQRFLIKGWVFVLFWRGCDPTPFKYTSVDFNYRNMKVRHSSLFEQLGFHSYKRTNAQEQDVDKKEGYFQEFYLKPLANWWKFFRGGWIPLLVTRLLTTPQFCISIPRRAYKAYHYKYNHYPSIFTVIYSQKSTVISWKIPKEFVSFYTWTSLLYVRLFIPLICSP